MLIGEYRHNLDNKKRLSVPSKLREELGKIVVITRGLDQCLFVYQQKEWEGLTQRLSNLPMGQADTRNFVRIILSGAHSVSFDGAGRILIPEHLKKYADLKNNVVIVGVYNRLELWDEERWDGHVKEMERNTDAMAEKLGQLGAF